MKETFMLIFVIIAFTSFSQQNQNGINRFEGDITQVDSITYKYDDKVLIVINTSSEFSSIFKKGILHPDLFISTGYDNDTQADIEDSDTSVIVIELENNCMYDSIFGNDSLTISDLKSIGSSRIKSKTMQFSFLLFRQGLANPTEYYIKLNNPNSNKKMDMKTFIEGARLIQIKIGSLLI